MSRLIFLNKIFILILFLFCFQSSVTAQDSLPTQEKKKYNLSQFMHETVLFIKQPFTWKGGDWVKVGIVTASTILIMQADQPIRNSTQGQQHFFYSVPMEGGRMYGEWYSIGGVAGAFGAYGLIAKNTKSKVIAIELVQAGLYSEALTAILKSTIGRERPYHDNGAVYSFHPFSLFDYNYHSLPSGHATSAVALSTVISRTASKTFYKILAYVPAGFTLFSRIYQDRHFASDEFLGAAIGYFVGNWVVDLHDEKKHRVIVTSVYPPGISIGLN